MNFYMIGTIRNQLLNSPAFHQNHQIPFLDILIKKNLENFESLGYTNCTSTTRDLNFNSNHPMLVKKVLQNV